MKRGDLVRTVPGWINPQRTGIVLDKSDLEHEYVKLLLVPLPEGVMQMTYCDTWQPVDKLEVIDEVQT